MTTQTNVSRMILEACGLAYAAGEHADKAKSGKASAADMMIAGLATDMDGLTVLDTTVSFSVVNRKGELIDTGKASIADLVQGSPIFKNEDGSDARAVQTAFRSSVLKGLCMIKPDLHQSAGAKAVWTCLTMSAKIAHELLGEGCGVELGEDGKLKVTGGEGDRAKAMRDAPSMSALRKLAAGETGTQGGNDEKVTGTVATPGEILGAALAIVRKVVKGDEALSGPALSRLREIAALVAGHPDVFGEGL